MLLNETLLIYARVSTTTVIVVCYRIVNFESEVIPKNVNGVFVKYE